MVDRRTDMGEGSGLRGDLRYCLTQATSGRDVITFEVTGTIKLTRALPDLARSVTIAGPGADQLTVRRATGGNYRIFTVTGTPTVVISGLTIANGRATQGGGIYVTGGALTLTDSILSNNQAVGADGVIGLPTGGNGEPGLGGGIYVAGGTVEVNSSTLTTNRAIGGNGGDSSRDGSGAPGAGAGIYVAGGTVEVRQSTLSANRSRGGNGGDGGGGRFSGRGGDGGNGLGGGLSVSGGAVEVQHSTLSTNQATGGLRGGGSPFGRAGQGMGGGLLFNMGTLRTRNTILAGNMAQTTAPDLADNLGSLGYNLIGNSTSGSGFDETDLLNVDPRLGPLQDNGGPTQTHALLEGSPAIDVGDNTDAPEFDQRGEGFPRIVNEIIDIGAFEFQGESGARPFTQRTNGHR